MLWKPNWPQTRERLTQWWNRQGLVVSIGAPRDGDPVEDIPRPAAPADLTQRWLDPCYRISASENSLAGRYWGTDAFPIVNTVIGPGSLGTFLGAQPRFAETTVWYEPCISDPDRAGPIRFDPNNHWFRTHMDLLEEGLRRANGRYAVGLPDLIENIDTLAAMRGTEPLLMDMLERPGWVEAKVEEINQAFFQAFDVMYERVKDPDGSMVFVTFALWGPGKTAKVQCDFSAMISPAMFRRFVQPALRRQCQWLDYSMYHLDGTTCIQHLDPLLEIEELDAIEWTPQTGLELGGHPRWHDMYRRILRAGKSLQVLGVDAEDVIPLLDSIGPKGVYILTEAKDQATAELVYQQAEQYH